MNQVISTEKYPIKLWLDDIEEGALKQAKNLANLPFLFKWVSIMSDAHQGYGMPIGGVIATRDVVIPNAVGVDIGCGMFACKTSLTDISVEDIKKIMGLIRERIPVGFKHHEEAHDKYMPDMINTRLTEYPGGLVVLEEYNSACKQVGTLGGGNHFIEIQEGAGRIWLMIHSGSRNLGKKVADHYNKIAVKLNQKWHSSVPKEWELAFLPLDSEEGNKYMAEMQYCVDFAEANRRFMGDIVRECFSEVIKDVVFEDEINIAHNYARMESHFNQNVMVHRKGATLAREDTMGIIPGSQGTKSYIVKGLGNPDSFHSCSHGAGRKMGRRQAKRELNLEEEIGKLDKQGIIHSIRGGRDLDEATGAYKDISVVMENQKDLVEILVELQPLAVIKG